MTAPRKQITCISCGAVVRRTYVKAKRGVCAICGVRRSADNARQLHAKSGPYWDAWVRAVAVWAAGEIGPALDAQAAAEVERRAALTPSPGGLGVRVSC